MSDQNKNYSVPVYCTNCDYGDTFKKLIAPRKSFPKGTEVPNRMTCPNCGCKTLRKR